MNNHNVDVNDLRKVIDPSRLNFKRSEDIQPLETIIGQKRAMKALNFGVGNKAFGFNIYVSGYPGTGRLSAVKNFIRKKSKEQESPVDWCYVNNFKDSYCPRAIKLPTGMATEFRNDMHDFIQDVKKVINKAFEESEYLNQKEDIVKSVEQKQNELFLSLNKKANKEGFTIQQTPFGVVPVPLNEKGEPMTDEQFRQLTESEQQNILAKQEELKKELKGNLRQTRNIEKETDEKVKKLDREVANNAISPLLEDIEEKYPGEEDVKHYLDEVKKDIIDNFSDFIEKDMKQEQQQQMMPYMPMQQQQQPSLKRYQVNVFIDNSNTEGAPMVQELNPTYNSLFGKVEKESRMGALTTDFTLIKSGSLHRANGGYLVIPVIELFRNPYSWDSLKKALLNKEIRIEEIGEKLGFLTTKSLRPEAIPLNLQIILIGRPEIYQLMYAYDSDFRNLFKIKAEFDTKLEMNDENINNYIAYVAKIQKEENLNTFNQDGLAKIIEHGCRLADDKNKLSAQFTEIYDIITEANYYSQIDGNGEVTGKDVKRAIEEKEYRSNMIKEKLQEMIENEMLILDVKGKKTGQVNGIAILNLQDFSFGKPNRITATTGVGSEGIIDIEREAELGGKIHTKGIMILSGYLTENYARNKPISLSARIVFEQSYQGVEGDSASCAELYTLLSSLSGLPMKQGIAVTGSVNQKGEVQAVGGINDKIEGYFEVCKMLGFTGEQGVIIPQSNIRTLMLKEEVVEAVKDGKFHIWAVKNINEGITILTGVKAGKRKDDGEFEEDTVNGMVDDRIRELANQMRDFAHYGQRNHTYTH
ncbi:MAG: Lon protease family protein [Bacteroidales bacterium]